MPIHDRERLETEGHDLAEIVALMASVFFFQIFRDGFFHADLHPGNLLVDTEGRVHAVDFGIMGRVDRPTRRYLADMLYSFLVRDYRRVAEIHVSAGLVPADQSVDGFAQAARAIAEPILGLPLNQISLARLVGQLFQVTKRFNMEVQPQLLLLQKTMLVAEGVGRRLHPETNMWELARPLIEEWMVEQMGPQARVRETVETLSDALARLPKALGDLERTVDVLAQNRIQLDPETVDALRSGLAGRRGGRGLWLAVLALAAAVAVLVWAEANAMSSEPDPGPGMMRQSLEKGEPGRCWTASAYS